MDQYAFYKMLQIRYPKVEVLMDVMNLFEYQHNGFELDKVFQIQRNEANMKDILRLSEIYPYTLPLQFIGQNLYRIRRKFFHKESFISFKDSTEYHEEILHLNSNKDYIFYGN